VNVCEHNGARQLCQPVAGVDDPLIPWGGGYFGSGSDRRSDSAIAARGPIEVTTLID
jgi:hypothetical protein